MGDSQPMRHSTTFIPYPAISHPRAGSGNADFSSTNPNPRLHAPPAHHRDDIAPRMPDAADPCWLAPDPCKASRENATASPGIMRRGKKSSGSSATVRCPSRSSLSTESKRAFADATPAPFASSHSPADISINANQMLMPGPSNLCVLIVLMEMKTSAAAPALHRGEGQIQRRWSAHQLRRNRQQRFRCARAAPSPILPDTAGSAAACPSMSSPADRSFAPEMPNPSMTIQALLPPTPQPQTRC